MLRFSNQTYRQKNVLFSINELELNLGEFVVLFGANGTGKSTWMKSIVKPVNNDFLIEGKAAGQLTQLELARKISFVDNHFYGLDHLRVSEYIALGRYPYTGISGILGEADQAVIKRITSKLQIEHLLDKSTSELSDGERQRCNIARTLIQETPVILLDEPTSFLDYPSKIELFQLLLDISRSENKLVIVSTHDIDMGLEYATSWCIISSNKEFIYRTGTLSKTDLLQLSFGEQTKH